MPGSPSRKQGAGQPARKARGPAPSPAHASARAPTRMRRLQSSPFQPAGQRHHPIMPSHTPAGKASQHSGSHTGGVAHGTASPHSKEMPGSSSGGVCEQAAAAHILPLAAAAPAPAHSPTQLHCAVVSLPHRHWRSPSGGALAGMGVCASYRPHQSPSAQPHRSSTTLGSGLAIGGRGRRCNRSAMCRPSLARPPS